jgi:hypothetical protein
MYREGKMEECTNGLCDASSIWLTEAESQYFRLMLQRVKTHAQGCAEYDALIADLEQLVDSGYSL